MSEVKPKRQPAVYLIAVWLLINAVFYAMEVTFLNDAADLNNSILLILSLVSTGALLLMRQYGRSIAVFALIYAFCFNAFNLIYFYSTLPEGALLINGVSALINAIAFTYLLHALTKNKP